MFYRTHLPNGKVLWLCDKHKNVKHLTLDNIESDLPQKQNKLNNLTDVNRSQQVPKLDPKTRFAAAALTVATAQSVPKKSNVCCVM